MSSYFLDVVLHALGIAISPLVVIAVVLLLFSPRARSNSLFFLVGWLIGLVVVGAAVMSIGGFGSHRGSDAVLIGSIELGIGLLLLVLGGLKWRQRSNAVGDQPTPSWMLAIDKCGPMKSAGLGVFFSAIYPKNLALAVVAASSIAVGHHGLNLEIAGYAVFIVISSVTVVAPIIFYLILSEKADRLLGRLKTWLVANSAIIMVWILLVFGIKLTVTGLLALTGY